MTYTIYYIHPETLSVNFRNFYESYDQAIKNLKYEAKEYIKMNKNVSEVEFTNKKKDINEKKNGYYLKMSNKYPNRISIYERTTKDVGYLMSNIIVLIKKVLVFSLVEMSSIPDTVNFSVNEVKKMIIPEIKLLFLDELKEKLKNRIIDNE